MTLRSYFTDASEKPSHPRIVRWQKLRESSDRIEVVFFRPWDGIVRGQPRLFVTFHPSNTCDEVKWELELDEWLIASQAQSSDETEEAARLSLHLAAAFRPIIDRHGGGYFNSVLVQHLRESPFAEDEAIQALLADIHENRPAPGEAMFDCTARIDKAIRQVASKLTTLHGDDTVLAEQILARTVASYLDERFHVAERQKLGLG